jgi:hypothetical protein
MYEDFLDGDDIAHLYGLIHHAQYTCQDQLIHQSFICADTFIY